VVGGSAYTATRPGPGRPRDAGTTIYEVHGEWKASGLWLRALGARADIDDVDTLNAGLGLTGADSVGEQLEGFYGELGYDVMGILDPESSVNDVARTCAGRASTRRPSVPSGFSSDPANDEETRARGVREPDPRAGVQGRGPGPRPRATTASTSSWATSSDARAPPALVRCCLLPPRLGGTAASVPAPARGKVFLTQAEALKLAFPECAIERRADLPLRGGQAARRRAGRQGRRRRSRVVYAYEARQRGKVVGTPTSTRTACGRWTRC
jgi:hypothetical protein